MKTIAKYFLLFAIILQFTKADEMGKVGDVIFESIEECDDPINKVDFKGGVKKKDDGTYSVDMTANFPYDVDDQATINFEGFKFNKDSGDYETEPFTEFENKEFFEFINGFVPNIWNNLKEAVSPPVTEPKRIKADKYVLKDFTAKSTDINQSVQVPYGKFLALVHIFQDNEELVCIKAKVELLKPTF